MSIADDFWVECAVCKQHLKNHTGSTPCCGSIAYVVGKDGEPTDSVSFFMCFNNGPIEATEIKLKK